MKSWTVDVNQNKTCILALGPESDGNFSVYNQGSIYTSDPFGDLLDIKNFKRFQTEVKDFLGRERLVPNLVLVDLHPQYVTTLWGHQLADRFGSEVVSVQHHIAHIFSAVGERLVMGQEIPKKFLGVACDGTGYGFDDKIWGGEVFEIDLLNKKVERFAHLENQILIGADLAIRQPARMLISILRKFLSKKETYKYVMQFYNTNQFEVLNSQMEQRFNCLETSSTGRVLDAVSVLLGFSKNERGFKHQPIALLEESSGEPYDLDPVIENEGERFVLLTTPLLQYLVENLDLDKKRLAATAQQYIAKGLLEITNKRGKQDIFFSGGVANNKIISSLLVSRGVIVSSEIPRGDGGISFGQLAYHLLANSRD